MPYSRKKTEIKDDKNIDNNDEEFLNGYALVFIFIIAYFFSIIFIYSIIKLLLENLL